MRLTLIVFILACALHVQSSESSSLLSMIDQGLVRVEITSLGGHQGACLRISGKNLTDQHLLARVEPGQIMRSANLDHQDILVTQPLLLTFEPHARTEGLVSGFCCQSQQRSPEAGARYTLATVADEQLTQLAKYLNDHGEIPSSEQQHAIWSISDCSPISSIAMYSEETRELRAFVSATLGIPLPWYTTTHKPSAETMMSAEIEKVEGELEFMIQGYQPVTVQVKDAENRVFTTLIREAIYGPGHYTFPVELRVNDWPSGAYQISLTSDQEQLIASYEFEL